MRSFRIFFILLILMATTACVGPKIKLFTDASDPLKESVLVWRNIMFSAASIATMTACIFLFGLFFSLLINFRYYCKECRGKALRLPFFLMMVWIRRRSTVSGSRIKAYKGVTKVEYVSAEEAWDEWSKRYFGDTELESEMAEGFKNDNPLANSSSYSVYVDKIGHRDALVKYIEGLDGVREVNQLKGATQTLSS